ncbi:MAG: ArnT family glycosyltransferase [Ardenticatenaceae bacterium]
MSIKKLLSSTTLLAFIAMLLLGILAFWFGWRYVTNVGLRIDEFSTLWGAHQTLEHGYPLMPSGVIYTRGILMSYLIAALATFGELSYTVGRLPSLFFGTVAVLATFYIGYREWNWRVGWIAALGLALLPEAITASGMARFYAPLLFFVLLTIWMAYQITQIPIHAQKKPSIRLYFLFVVCFILALFSQEETILLVPGLVLGWWLWRGWRYLFQPQPFFSLVACLVALIVRYIIEIKGQPGYFEAMQNEHKTYIELNYFDVVGAWETYSDLYISTDRLLWTSFAILSLIALFYVLWNKKGKLTALPPFYQATFFFSMQFILVFIMLLTIVGHDWRKPRFVLMVQPFWLLVGATGMVLLIDQLKKHIRINIRAFHWHLLTIGGVSTLILALMWPEAIYTTRVMRGHYERTLAYLAANLQPEDVVISTQPPACAFGIGFACDYYVLQEGYKAYVTQRDGVWIDRWTGAKLLNEPDALRQLTREASRVWLMSDTDRLAKRFESDFTRVFLEQFEVEYKTGEIRLLLAPNWRSSPNYVSQKTFDVPLKIGPLILSSWERSEIELGQPMELLLWWGNKEPIYEKISTSLQLVASDGTHLIQDDGPLANNVFELHKLPSDGLPDMKRLVLPTNLTSGRYRLELMAYESNTREALSDFQPIAWFHIGHPPSAADEIINVSWQNGITLIGHDALPDSVPTEPLNLRLFWQTSKSIPLDYTIFAHLVGPNGQLVAQSDHPPEGGFYPTSAWVIGDLVEDHHTLQLPLTLPAGEYRLLAGWYQLNSGERLLLTDGSDAFELGRWQVK